MSPYFDMPKKNRAEVGYVGQDDVEGTVTLSIDGARLTINALSDEHFKTLIGALKAVHEVREYHDFKGEIELVTLETSSRLKP